MSFPKYESYKGSGIEWLGEVPGHWEIARLGGLFREVNEPGETALPILSVSIHNGVSDRELTDDEMDRKVARSDDLSKYKRVEPGDLVYNMMRAWQGGFGTVTVSGMVSPAYVVARPSRLLSTSFIELLLRTPFAVEEMRRLSKGVTDFRLRLYWDEFKAFKVLVPPDSEQDAIAAFLDMETAKIDILVEGQKRLIELLKEKRQAVISHAVTKGLDPNVPMKDSGVEWLGEIPAHWEASAIKRHCVRITDGAHISPETENGLYCFVSTKDVGESGIKFDGCLLTSEASYEYLVRTGCRPQKGDVLFSKDGTIGRTVVIQEDREFVVASSLIIIRPDSRTLNSLFLHFLCQSAFVRSQVQSYVKGAGLPRLSIQNLLKVVGVFPSEPEQRKIVEFLASVTSSFDSLIAEAAGAIDLLFERRSSIISAAVTGKIDVRDQLPARVAAE